MPVLEELYAMERAKQISMDTWTWNIFTPAPLAPGQTVQISFQVDADSDFLARYVNLTLWQGSPGPPPNMNVYQFPPPLLWSISDTGSGRNLQNQPYSGSNMAGGAAFPMGMLPGILPEPKLFVAASVVTVTLNSPAAIGTTTFGRVDVTFIGNKIFYFGQFKRGTMP